jgi:hypothetical protein
LGDGKRRPRKRKNRLEISIFPFLTCPFPQARPWR